MAKLFDSVQIKAPSRNKFDLSHERKFSFNMGELVPIMVQEIIPGDSFRTRAELMMRLAPMLAPIMHRVNVKMEFFFVPNRLVWSEWEDFITGGRLGTSAPVMPNASMAAIQAAGWGAQGMLTDYMGLPLNVAAPAANGVTISMLPFRAYQLIYDEYYRDQNLTASLDISTASGAVAGAELDKIMEMRTRAWEKDYFTSALPFAQRGATVDVPITTDGVTPTIAYRADAGGVPFSQAGDATIGANAHVLMTGSAAQDGNVNLGAEGHGINVLDLRRSIRLQEWLELAARVGGRYTEVLKGFFNVRPDDARLQRPEFLGGGVTPVRISEVLSTVQQVDPTTGDPVGNPQGDMSGHGVSIGNQNGFSRFFKEHGFVIGIVSCLPRTAYQQGIHKMWTRSDKFDYFWKQFANIGEQAVLNKELYFDDVITNAEADATFGYQSRYSEYKYACSTVHGDFKTSLAFWHMGRIFSALPVLDQTFIQADPTHRIFAVDDPGVHKLWCHCYLAVDAIRPMPYFGTPTL